MPTRVLVVTEDSTVAAEARHGFAQDIEPVVVGDARTALAAMDKLVPALVIVDLQSGSAGGYSLLKEMAHAARLAGVPSLMLIDRVQDEWLARQAGATEIRVKPLHTPELVEAALGLIASRS